MNRNLIVTSFVAATLSLFALPAGAQDRHERSGARNRGGEQHAQQGPAPRQEGRQQAVPRTAPRAENGGQRAVPRGGYDRPSNQAPAYRPEARGGYAVPRGDNRGYGPRYQDRRDDSHGYYARPYNSRPYARPYNYVPYRPYYFGRPYYSFRPHWNIGFGLWIGYPVPYPYGYLGSYSPRVYGDYPDGGYSVSVYGGVSFDIQPADADVFVDGQFVGRTGDFTPGMAPLTLTPGSHHIAVQRDGFAPMEWDATVQPGQVIPYRGNMQTY